MALEIERKFLIQGNTWRQAVSATLKIDQGYLVEPGGPASVRVRLQGDEARLNIKAANIGRARAEYDYPVSVEDAREMLQTLCVGRIEKQRHLVTFGTHLWEIDEFFGANAGLIVAEIELDSVDERFDRPPWLGEEVTDDRRYYNHALCLQPYREWCDEA